MRVRQRSLATGRDGAPIEMLEALFEARGWPCLWNREDEISTQIEGSWTKYQLRCVWRREDHVLQLICLPDIKVGAAKRAQGYELLALVNEQMWLGHFDIWSDGHILLYRHGVLLGDEGMLSLDQAQALIESAIDECDRFYPAFQFVLWGDKTPREALESALVDAAGEA